MRIAIVAEDIFPLSVGGMQNHSTQLAIHLARAGANVELYFRGRIDASRSLAMLEDEGVRLNPIEWTTFPKLPGHYVRELRRYSARVRNAMEKRSDIDWIYVQGLSGLALLDDPAPHLPPVAINMHGLEMFQRAATVRGRAEQLLLRPPARVCLRNADLVFSLGGKLTPLIESIGIPHEKVSETPIGISDDWIADSPLPPQRPRRMVFVGRYERRKGVEEITNVLRRLSRTEQIDFQFVGPVPDEDALRIPGVERRGLVTDRTVLMELLTACDIIVCPSWAEGMPTVILEGMARGLAVIATDVGAINELVFGNNGWLIQPGDTLALERAMRDAMSLTDDELHAMKKASLEIAGARFRWTDVAAATLDTFTAKGIRKA